MKNLKDEISLFETHFHPSPNINKNDYYHDCIESGVKYLLAVGSNYETSLLAGKYADSFENIWFAAGAHPHEASQYVSRISEFANFAEHEKFVAVGEIGLDYFYNNSEREIQIKVFRDFLKMSKDLKKPAIIHCRDKDGHEDAYNDIYSELKGFVRSGGKFVIHCFSGTVEWAEKFLEMGAYLGITGIVTFPKAQNVRDALRAIPLDRLLIETDTPYLAPVPKRGKTNHSKYLTYIAEKIAEEKMLSYEEIAEITTENAKNLLLLNH